MTTEPFDPQKVIKELAEAEWVCTYPKAATWNAENGNLIDCVSCSGTSRIVPFASLRVERDGPVWSHRDCHSLGHCDIKEGIPDWPRDCAGRGWIPEPDVEKACWRVLNVLLDVSTDEADSMLWSPRDETREATVLRAASVWLDEKIKEKP